MKSGAASFPKTHWRENFEITLEGSIKTLRSGLPRFTGWYLASVCGSNDSQNAWSDPVPDGALDPGKNSHTGTISAVFPTGWSHFRSVLRVDVRALPKAPWRLP